jgi:hypothetical protein
VPRTCPSRVVTATLLGKVAEVVALPDCCSEVPDDRVRNRDVEEEVGQHQVPDVVFAAKPPAQDERYYNNSNVRDCAPAILSGCRLCGKPQVSRSRPFNAGYIIRMLWDRLRVTLHQLRHVRFHLVAAYGELFSERYHVGREPLSMDPPRFKPLVRSSAWA